MKKIVKFGVMPLLALVFIGCNAAVLETYTNMSWLEMYQCIETENHELDPVIQYSSRSCLFTNTADDSFFRALKHKETGVIRYQLYAIFFNDDWQFPNQLNYKFDDKLISSQAIRIDSNVSCGSSCFHREEIAFYIEENYVMDLSKRYDEIKDDGLITMRVQKQKGKSQDILFNPAELVALHRRARENREGE